MAHGKPELCFPANPLGQETLERSSRGAAASDRIERTDLRARLPGTNFRSNLQRMKAMAYCVYREDEFFVAQCLNVDVSSFGVTREEAIANLKEAVELYFEGEPADAYTPVTDAAVGQELVNA